MNKKPNILMIVTDQEYAHQSLPAGFALSNRDRIHSRGVTFVNHHATTTVCTPSRSVMLTGRHAPHTGMFDNNTLRGSLEGVDARKEMPFKPLSAEEAVRRLLDGVAAEPDVCGRLQSKR